MAECPVGIDFGISIKLRWLQLMLCSLESEAGAGFFY